MAMIGRTLAAGVAALAACAVAWPQGVVIGSKRFTESYVLAEIAKKLCERAGLNVEHKEGMGGTIILWNALRSGQIHFYPDYTGTIAEEILKRKDRPTLESLRSELARYGVGVTQSLGFEDKYALAVSTGQAKRLGLRRISDLTRHPELVVGVTPEFHDRQDGWKALAEVYRLHMKDVRTIEHSLGYEALLAGHTSIKDAYTTDARLVDGNITLLEDDKRFFPEYHCVFLYRLDAPKDAIEAIKQLEGAISRQEMVRLNAEAERTKNYALAAASFFGGQARASQAAQGDRTAARILGWTLEHLRLAGISLLLAVLVGIPLGIRASRKDALSHAIVGFVGVVQTIPSLALLALLVPLPFFGIGAQTAIAALFLYSLLPIVRNTATGLRDIPVSIRESAAAMGLEPRAQLRKVFLPMASRSILAGISTSAVINVGTATLAALIGSGGLGTPIVSGLNLNDPPTILQGAIPAAALAIFVQLLFEGLERLVIPKGLRLEARS